MPWDHGGRNAKGWTGQRAGIPIPLRARHRSRIPAVDQIKRRDETRRDETTSEHDKFLYRVDHSQRTNKSRAPTLPSHLPPQHSDKTLTCPWPCFSTNKLLPLAQREIRVCCTCEAPRGNSACPTRHAVRRYENTKSEPRTSHGVSLKGIAQQKSDSCTPASTSVRLSCR